MATKTQKDVKGVRSDTTSAEPVRIMPTDMENKSLSRDQFIEKRKKLKAAEAAADAARDKALADYGKEEPAEEKPTSQLEALRSRLAEITERLEKDPANEKLLKQQKKLAKELDKAEEAEE